MKTHELCWSIVANFTGQHPRLSDWYPCDTTLADALRAWKDATSDEVEPSDPFDSEYNYCAHEGGIPKRVLDAIDWSRGETRFRICKKIKERWPRKAFWACISDAQMSGILSRKKLFQFLDDIGASFDDCETLGTLGGPIAPCGGVVPDFSFNVESVALIACIRITPVLMYSDGTGQWVSRGPSKDRWNRILNILRESDPFDILKGKAFAKATEAHANI